LAKKPDALDIISEQLSVLIRLAAFQVADTRDTLERKAVVLSNLGLDPSLIAEVCGTTRNTISVRLSEAKKRGTGRKAGNKPITA